MAKSSSTSSKKRKPVVAKVPPSDKTTSTTSATPEPRTLSEYSHQLGGLYILTGRLGSSRLGGFLTLEGNRPELADDPKVPMQNKGVHDSDATPPSAHNTQGGTSVRTKALTNVKVRASRRKVPVVQLDEVGEESGPEGDAMAATEDEVLE
jgi:hypothetical protein